jgi:hypothetical protein
MSRRPLHPRLYSRLQLLAAAGQLPADHPAWSWEEDPDNPGHKRPEPEATRHGAWVMVSMIDGRQMRRTMVRH